MTPMRRAGVNRASRAAWLWLCAQCALAALPLGCVRKTIPAGRSAIAHVELNGSSTHQDEILAGLATLPSEQFIGIWDGVAFEYQLYDPELLKQDLERVERFLRARGYYEARVVAAEVRSVGRHRLRVAIRVSQGVPVLVRSVRFQGLEKLPLAVSSQAFAQSRIHTGLPLDERDYAQSKAAVVKTLLNRGYAFASVSGQVWVDIAKHAADVQFLVRPGPPSTFGRITVRGLRRVPENIVRANLGLVEGQEYSEEDLEDARRALLHLGVFSGVRVRPRLAEAEDQRVPITFELEEAPLRSLHVGLGARLDALQLSNHLTLGWEHKNLFGGLRHLELQGRPGLIYFPTRFPDIQPPDRVLVQTEVNARLTKPSFIEGRTTGGLNAEFNLSPLIFASSGQEQGLIGFAEFRASGSLERAFWEHHLKLNPSFNWQWDNPIDYAPLTLGSSPTVKDELLDSLILAYPELSASLDFRDNPLQTRNGTLFKVQLQWADTSLSSDASDWRIRLEGRGYFAISPTLVLASRGALGALYPRDYATSLDTPSDEGTRVRDQQLLLFRGFFSGGPTSNRGYALRAVGPHGSVPFLGGRDHPLGGLSFWELSAELRWQLAGPLGAVLFLDGSDVQRQVAYTLGAPHLSAGLGVRYQTPVGPVRLDAGYQLPGAQRLEARPLEPQQRAELPTLHLAFGEAF